MYPVLIWNEISIQNFVSKQNKWPNLIFSQCLNHEWFKKYRSMTKQLWIFSTNRMHHSSTTRNLLFYWNNLYFRSTLQKKLKMKWFDVPIRRWKLRFAFNLSLQLSHTNCCLINQHIGNTMSSRKEMK